MAECWFGESRAASRVDCRHCGAGRARNNNKGSASDYFVASAAQHLDWRRYVLIGSTESAHSQCRAQSRQAGWHAALDNTLIEVCGGTACYISGPANAQGDIVLAMPCLVLLHFESLRLFLSLARSTSARWVPICDFKLFQTHARSVILMSPLLIHDFPCLRSHSISLLCTPKRQLLFCAAPSRKRRRCRFQRGARFRGDCILQILLPIQQRRDSAEWSLQHAWGQGSAILKLCIKNFFNYYYKWKSWCTRIPFKRSAKYGIIFW